MDIQQNLKCILQRIRDAESLHGRTIHSVQLLAVSKKHSIDTIRKAVAAGQVLFGENYAQEGVEKIKMLKSVPIEWHFIGPIQSNKTKQIAQYFAWVHSVDREKIAQRLNDQRPVHLPPLNVCIEVNVSHEASKSGVPPDELVSFAEFVQGLPQLKLRGLMTIPEPCEDFEVKRKPFRELAHLFQQLNDRGMSLDTLSMGMSDDFEAAIAEGATIVRVGSAIFGSRDSENSSNR